MGSSTIKKAIGAVKDHTSISLAKVAGNIAPDLEVLILKATSHDNEPADEKYVKEIFNMISSSRSYVNAAVGAISRRLGKTRDWVVALKALFLVHRLLNHGDPVFGEEMTRMNRSGGRRILNMSDFRDDAHSRSWDQSGFVRNFASFLDKKLELMMYERNLSGNVEPRDEAGYEMDKRSNKGTQIEKLGPKKLLERLNQLLRFLDRFLALRPTGAAENSRMVLIALNLVVKESFTLYADVSDVLKYLLDGFLELEYVDSVSAFNAYVDASRMIDELLRFYSWCKDIGVVRRSEFPEAVKISGKLLNTLEGLLMEKGNRRKSPKENKEEETLSEIKEDNASMMNEIKALPPPENHNIPTVIHKQALNEPLQNQEATEDLVNMKDGGVSGDQQDNSMELALFSDDPNGKWLQFPTDGMEPKVTSAWQNPAAESSNVDWESALVESASNLSKQTADLAGDFDSLLLNGMYDHGMISQHAKHSQAKGGSVSSVALPGDGGNETASQMMPALPTPDGTVQPQDPFAASLLVPAPAYVQIADMERKQELLTQEQQLWQQYAVSGVQGQPGLGPQAVYDVSRIQGQPGLGPQAVYDVSGVQGQPGLGHQAVYDANVPYGLQTTIGPGQPWGRYTSY